jgi:hypothetical protein
MTLRLLRFFEYAARRVVHPATRCRRCDEEWKPAGVIMMMIMCTVAVFFFKFQRWTTAATDEFHVPLNFTDSVTSLGCTLPVSLLELDHMVYTLVLHLRNSSKFGSIL